MSESKRAVKLFCPAISKAVHLVAHDDQKLDLGSIARTFGLDPATVKLNGHFISRGVDLIASSVTWKSLIKFFSSRGLSTGTNGSAALVVDGKLSKSGSKRGNDSADEIHSTTKNFIKKTKFKDLGNPFSLKRKQEDYSSSFKKLKMEESDSQTRNETLFKTRVGCSFVGVNMKRMREDEIVLPVSCKKITQHRELGFSFTN